MLIFGTIIAVFVGTMLGYIVGDILKTAKGRRNGNIYGLTMLCSVLVLSIGIAMSVLGFI